jgi:hypothetical protein
MPKKYNGFFEFDPKEISKLTKIAKPVGSEGEPLTTPLLDNLVRKGLFEAKADTWGKTTVYVSRASEITMEELSQKLGFPIRRSQLEVNSIYNSAMCIMGMVLAILPKKWEEEVKRKIPEETVEAFIDYVHKFLASRS